MSSAGPCVSYWGRRKTQVPIMCISGGPDSATIVREVARVQLAHDDLAFALCERGRSYLLFRYDRTLQLMDVATGQPKRTYSPCELSIFYGVLCLLTLFSPWIRCFAM